MKLIEMIQAVKSENKMLQGMNDKRAVSIVRAVFKQLRTRIDETGEGKFVVPSLGKFVIKQVVRKGEEKTGVTVKRVVLRELKAKPEGAKGKKESAASK